jgi:hypothetical protein
VRIAPLFSNGDDRVWLFFFGDCFSLMDVSLSRKDGSMAQHSTFHFVQLWQDAHQPAPTLQQWVLAPSEGHAVVQVMKQHHLRAVARAWVSPSALEMPTVRLSCVLVKGKVRSWKHDLTPLQERRG